MMSSGGGQNSPRHQSNVIEGYRIRYRPVYDDATSDDPSPTEYSTKSVRPGDVSQFTVTGNNLVIGESSYLEPEARQMNVITVYTKSKNSYWNYVRPVSFGSTIAYCYEMLQWVNEFLT